jgi:4-hydroxybenzoate polyprenyltransferase
VAALAIALIAGAHLDVAFRLGLGMLALQFCIGSANDVADALPDAVAKPRKPIPSGDVSRTAAVIVVFVSGGLGLTVAASVGAGALAIGCVGLADGLLYDLKLKRTPLAWMPFAAGVGLLPIYAWWGTRGYLPVAFAGIASMAVLAGVALALANAYADIEGDRKSGVASVATFLGPARTVRLNAALLAGIQLLALATTFAAGSVSPPVLLAELGGCALGWLGLGLAASRADRIRPLVWEVQAVGFLILGAAWLVSLTQAGVLVG